MGGWGRALCHEFHSLARRSACVRSLLNEITGVDTFDGRSDDKGAEPEGLVMAEIDGRFVHT